MSSRGKWLRPPRKPPTCHPDRPLSARGLCGACYQEQRARRLGIPADVKGRQPATCHPDRFTHGYGLCAQCYNKQKRPKHTAIARKSYLKRAYGLTPADIDAMFAAQRGLCACCEQSLTKTPHTDHDHITGRVRALLCSGCNQGLGYFKDSPARLRLAADYIERHAAIHALETTK